MRIGDLRTIINQYDDASLVLLKHRLGTGLRIDKGLIAPTRHDDDLFEIIDAEKDEKTNSLVLKIE